MKFGGTCLGSNEMMSKVEDVIRAEKDNKVVVVSAVGGVTDRLVGFMESFHSDDEIDAFIKELKKIHTKLLPSDKELHATALKDMKQRFDKLENLLYGVSYTEEITPRTRDLIVSMGERLSSIVMATRLKAKDVSAAFFNADELGIITDGYHGNATADLKECEKNVGPKIRALIKADVTPVVTGFFGISEEGHVTTFGRGGTDYSASVLGRASGASVIEIWKDVDGFMTADPKMAPNARQVEKLSYEEAAELAYFGAKVLHPRTVFPAMEKDIPVAIRNVLKPDSPGTIICRDTSKRKNVLKSVSFLKDIATIKVYGTGAGYKRGFLADITEGMADAGINIYSATTSQTCVAMLVDKSEVKNAKKILEHLLGGYYENIEVQENIALICAVGAGLASAKGIAAKTFNVISLNGVNVDLISAGASTVAFHFTINKKDLEITIRKLHDEFF